MNIMGDFKIIDGEINDFYKMISIRSYALLKNWFEMGD
jgi:hypothetical protein